MRLTATENGQDTGFQSRDTGTRVQVPAKAFSFIFLNAKFQSAKHKKIC